MGLWKETLCSRYPDSSQRDRVGHVLPTWAGLRGLPAGMGGHQVWLVFKCPGFGFSSHSLHSALVGQSEAPHRWAASAHTKSRACGMCSTPDKPCADLWSHSVASPPAVFKHFYICGSS